MRRDDHIDVAAKKVLLNDASTSSVKKESFRATEKQQILVGWEKWLAYINNNISDLRAIFLKYRSPIKAIKGLKQTFSLFRRVPGVLYSKMAKVDGKYWRVHYIPGWGTSVQKKYLLSQIGKMLPHGGAVSRLLNVYFAITKKCNYKCEHCFEWDTINEKEELSRNDLQKIFSNLAKSGTCVIHLTGGEPMQRLNDLLPIIRKHGQDTIFWMLTSGFNFTKENAEQLKTAGLTGAVISLDHFEREEQDRFRGVRGSYDTVLMAVKNAIEQKLVCVLSLCINKKIANRNFLMKYMELAKDLGVAFVQILEAEAVGRYKGKDVGLDKDQIEMLESFYIDINKSKRFKRYPILVYHGYYQRRIGCLSSGRNSLYINADGGVSSCPFCKSYAGNVLQEDIAELSDVLANRGCTKFKNIPF